MSLRLKTLLVLGTVLAVAATALFATVSRNLLVSYEEIERRLAFQDLARLHKVFLADMRQTFMLIEDYASWDDTYAFAEDPDPEYVRSNLDGDTLSSLGLNLAVIVDSDGEKLFSRQIERGTSRESLVPNELLVRLNTEGDLTYRIPGESAEYGLIRLEDKALMVALAPILRSDDTGPSRGTLIFGRILDDDSLRALRERTQLDIAFDLVDPDERNPVRASLIDRLDAQTGGGYFDLSEAPADLTIVSGDRLFGYLLMPDIDGNPLVLWQVSLPRDIYTQGTSSLAVLLASLAGIGVLLIGAVLFLLDRLVLVRLFRLSADVGDIGVNNDLSYRVSVRGEDELADLGQAVNHMLERLEKSERMLRHEHERAEGLLLNILPAPIAGQLKNGRSAIADTHDDVSVLFADIVGFTAMSADMDPVDLVGMLNDVFSRFDALAGELGLEKIKTIGDAYMVAAGLPTPQRNHAEAIAEMALRMRASLEDYNRQHGTTLQIRVGINSGTVVAGVIGTRKFIYDLWGDAVNIASRMETSGEAGMIQVTEQTRALLKDKYILKDRGTREIKGRGRMATYLLAGRKNVGTRPAA